MASRFKPITVRPADGGRLLTAVSTGEVGIGNYTVKRDWRRHLRDEVRREGYDYFVPLPASPVGKQPFPHRIANDDPGPINMIHEVRRQNGQRTVIVGTPGSLYKFIGSDGSGVYDIGVFEDGVFSEEDAEWSRVGTGFRAVNGWEVENISGYLVLNNGSDLPMTYRMEDSEVRPIYELREQSIARVGTISAISGVLTCFDLYEIPNQNMAELFERRGVTQSGNVTAKQSGTVVTTTSPVFVVGDEGKTVEFADGTKVHIVAVIDEYSVDVDSDDEVSQQTFRIKTRASQSGAVSSVNVLATILAGAFTVTTTEDLFVVGHVGKYIRFQNGWNAKIMSVPDARTATLDAVAPDSVTSPVFITSSVQSEAGSADYTVVAISPTFTPDMVGSELVWDSGSPRLIIEYIAPTVVRVDSDIPEPLGDFGVENHETYAYYSGVTDRVSYRATWAMQDQPRRFAANLVGSIEDDGGVVKLAYPAKSLEAGMKLAVAGAGPGGSNLIATILYIEGSQFIGLDTPASVGVTSAQVAAADSIGSIVSYEDLEADGTPIRRAAPLKDVLVIYKDTAIFLAKFTGSTDRPFEFARREINIVSSLFHPKTLVNVNSTFHVYAGRSSFWRLDLSNQIPVMIDTAEGCKDVFFDHAWKDAPSVFAAENPVTREAFFWFGGDGLDRALCLDYATETWSTTSINATAAGTASRMDGTTDEKWFLMAVAGSLVVYGKSERPTWGDGQRSAIYYRRAGYPYSPNAATYTSTLRYGLSDFGNLHTEKDVRSLVPMLSSQSEGKVLNVSVFGGRNPSEEVTLASKAFDATIDNLVPLFFRQCYLGCEVSVSHGYDSRLCSVTWEVSGVDSRSDSRIT